ncbi:MAG: phosphatase PAP2 family protein [Clostridiales bacterium]|nr:phosphatase PAP2 family protein [Clostridiales bacterium]
MRFRESFRQKSRKAAAWLSSHPLSIAVAYAMFYFPMFFYLEHRTVTEYHVIHCALDDALPYCAAFAVPYVSWFLLIPGMLLYFLKREPRCYYELCWLLFGGMTVSLLFYLVFPNCIYLRQPVSGDGLCNQLVLFIRMVDTPTNVCPSIHVASTVAVMTEAGRSERLRPRRWLRCGLWLLGVSICLATVLLDQHSVVDVVCGVALTMVLSNVMELWLQRRSLRDVSPRKPVRRAE